MPQARPRTRLPAPGRLIPVILAPVILALTIPSVCGAQEMTTVVADAPKSEAAAPANPRLSHFTTYSMRGESKGGPSEGAGLFATAQDSAVNLASPDRLVEGPNGSLFNQAAGFGWHNHTVSAMVGYMKPSSVHGATQFRSDDYTPSFKSSARVGLGFAVHF